MEKMDSDLKHFIKHFKNIKTKTKKILHQNNKKTYKSKSIYINYNLNLIKYIIKKILNSLECLHKNKIIYNDLKLSNILWNYHNKEIKLTDFNCITEKSKKMRACSTLTFRSPEQIHSNSDNVTYKTDVWSLGVILISLLKKEPYSYFRKDNKEQIKYDIINFKNSQIPYIINSCRKNVVSFSNNDYFQIIDFLKKILINQEKRMSVQECLKHPFLK